jgi:hypothetical protein
MSQSALTREIARKSLVLGEAFPSDLSLVSLVTRHFLRWLGPLHWSVIYFARFRTSLRIPRERLGHNLFLKPSPRGMLSAKKGFGGDSPGTLAHLACD